MQPFAHLIVTPQHKLPTGIVRKRVENRTWSTGYRGPLLIHAGKSKRLMRPEDKQFGELAFGAIVGVADLVNCVLLNKVFNVPTNEWEWLRAHKHAEGQWCWVLENVHPISTPVPYVGRQGLVDIECEVIVGPGDGGDATAFLMIGKDKLSKLIEMPLVTGGTVWDEKQGRWITPEANDDA